MPRGWPPGCADGVRDRVGRSQAALAVRRDKPQLGLGQLPIPGLGQRARVVDRCRQRPRVQVVEPFPQPALGPFAVGECGIQLAAAAAEQRQVVAADIAVRVIIAELGHVAGQAVLPGSHGGRRPAGGVQVHRVTDRGRHGLFVLVPEVPPVQLDQLMAGVDDPGRWALTGGAPQRELGAHGPELLGVFAALVAALVDVPEVLGQQLQGPGVVTDQGEQHREAGPRLPDPRMVPAQDAQPAGVVGPVQRQRLPDVAHLQHGLHQVVRHHQGLGVVGSEGLGEQPPGALVLGECFVQPPEPAQVAAEAAAGHQRPRVPAPQRAALADQQVTIDRQRLAVPAQLPQQVGPLGGEPADEPVGLAELAGPCGVQPVAHGDPHGPRLVVAQLVQVAHLADQPLPHPPPVAARNGGVAEPWPQLGVVRLHRPGRAEVPVQLGELAVVAVGSGLRRPEGGQAAQRGGLGGAALRPLHRRQQGVLQHAVHAKGRRVPPVDLEQPEPGSDPQHPVQLRLVGEQDLAVAAGHDGQPGEHGPGLHDVDHDAVGGDEGAALRQLDAQPAVGRLAQGGQGEPQDVPHGWQLGRPGLAGHLLTMQELVQQLPAGLCGRRRGRLAPAQDRGALGEPGCRQLQRHRGVVQRAGDAHGVLGWQLGQPTARSSQQLQAVLGIQTADQQRCLRHAAQRLRGRDDHVHRPARRQQVADGLVGGVVVDQQVPQRGVRGVGEPVEHGGRRIAGARYLQRAGECRQPVTHRLPLGGRHPPHELVQGAEPVCVLAGDLALAGAVRALEHREPGAPWVGAGVQGAQLVAQHLQVGGAADEQRVRAGYARLFERHAGIAWREAHLGGGQVGPFEHACRLEQLPPRPAGIGRGEVDDGARQPLRRRCAVDPDRYQLYRFARRQPVDGTLQLPCRCGGGEPRGGDEDQRAAGRRPGLRAQPVDEHTARPQLLGDPVGPSPVTRVVAEQQDIGRARLAQLQRQPVPGHGRGRQRSSGSASRGRVPAGDPGDPVDQPPVRLDDRSVRTWWLGEDTDHTVLVAVRPVGQLGERDTGRFAAIARDEVAERAAGPVQLAARRLRGAGVPGGRRGDQPDPSWRRVPQRDRELGRGARGELVGQVAHRGRIAQPSRGRRVGIRRQHKQYQRVARAVVRRTAQRGTHLAGGWHGELGEPRHAGLFVAQHVDGRRQVSGRTPAQHGRERPVGHRKAADGRGFHRLGELVEQVLAEAFVRRRRGTGEVP